MYGYKQLKLETIEYETVDRVDRVLWNATHLCMHVFYQST